MVYFDFEHVMSSKRMSRYLNACDGDKRKAQALYRLNLRLSQEMFTIISCYEVALRNAIDRIMSSSPQYLATGRKLLNVFPNKPKSSATRQYNNQFIYNELDAINRLRNRIAHHEPICFLQDQEKISTVYLHHSYQRILSLFSWMGIDSQSLLYGLDHVQKLSQRIEKMK